MVEGGDAGSCGGPRGPGHDAAAVAAALARAGARGGGDGSGGAAVNAWPHARGGGLLATALARAEAWLLEPAAPRAAAPSPAPPPRPVVVGRGLARGGGASPGAPGPAGALAAGRRVAVVANWVEPQEVEDVESPPSHQCGALGARLEIPKSRLAAQLALGCREARGAFAKPIAELADRCRAAAA